MGVPDAKTIKLYLRLPVKIVDEQQVKQLHGAITKVTLPRQKSRRWCVIEFDKTKIKELKAVRVDGRKIYVSAHTTKEEDKKNRMGAGGFIRNPGWDILSSDDLVEEDHDNAIVMDALFHDGELNEEIVLILPPTDEELDDDEDDSSDYFDEMEEDEDDDFVSSETNEDNDFISSDTNEDNDIFSSDDSSPESSN